MSTFKIIYTQRAVTISTEINGQLTAEEYFELCLDQAKAMGFHTDSMKKAIHKIKKEV